MFSCQSCGMPMDKPEDHGGGNAQVPYCKYCAGADGKLLPREIVKNKMIDFRVKAHSILRDQAEREIENFMIKMPAWSNKPLASQNLGGSSQPLSSPSLAPLAPHPVTSSPAPSSNLPFVKPFTPQPVVLPPRPITAPAVGIQKPPPPPPVTPSANLPVTPPPAVKGDSPFVVKPAVAQSTAPSPNFATPAVGIQRTQPFSAKPSGSIVPGGASVQPTSSGLVFGGDQKPKQS